MFDYAVLSEFRTRLIAGGVEHLLLGTMLKDLQERGLLKGWGTQRPDSTHILAAIRALNRLEAAEGRSSDIRTCLDVSDKLLLGWTR